MTVSSTTTKSSHSGNGVLDTFAYAFKIFADDDLVVIIRTNSTGAETTKTKTTHYTVTGVGSASGGNVVFTSGNIPASGETVVIKRSLTLTQATDYVANDPFPADSHEDALDRLTMIAQQQQEVFDRAVVLPETDTASTTIPDSVTRASKYLAFNSSGDFIAAAGTADVTPISSAMEPVVEASTLAAGRTALLSGTNLSVNTANTIISTDTNGNITLDPNGTGTVAIASDVAITGGLTATDGCTITTADNDPQLTLISTDADASSGPRIDLKRNSASPDDADVLGDIRFIGKNDAGSPEDITYARIAAEAHDVSDGTEDGVLYINSMVAGTSRSRIEVDFDGIVINQEGIDLDFRIETTASAYGLLVDGADAKVEVGGNNGTDQALIINQTRNSQTLHMLPSNGSLSAAILSSECTKSGASTFEHIKMSSNGTSDLEFKVRGDGEVTADGSFSGGGADYAEYFEWSDGNSSSEDRRGYSVVLDGNKIRKATSSDAAASIIGIVSARPVVVGDAAWNHWAGRWERDDYGDAVKEAYTITTWNTLDENGKIANSHSYQTDKIPSDITVPKDAVVTSKEADGTTNLMRRKEASNYDASKTYVPRENRAEWDTIGLMGKLRMRKGQPTGDRWIKLRDISSDVEEWLVR